MTFTGKHVFLMVAGFFLIIFIANAFLVYFAMDSFSGLETEDPYQKGVAYNQNIKQAKAQQQSGLTVNIKITPQPSRVISFKITALKSDSKPLAGKQVKLSFFRPAKEGFDQTPRIFEHSPGIYSGQAQLPFPGIWDLKLDILEGDKNLYRTKSRIEVK